MGKQKIIPGDTTEAKWPRPEKVESMLSTVQGNSVICLVQVNNFPPFALEVKYGLVSFLYHEDTSVIHLTLHSLSCSFFFCQHFSILSVFHTLCSLQIPYPPLRVKSPYCCNSLFTDLFAFRLELMKM